MASINALLDLALVQVVEQRLLLERHEEHLDGTALIIVDLIKLNTTSRRIAVLTSPMPANSTDQRQRIAPAFASGTRKYQGIATKR